MPQAVFVDDLQSVAGLLIAELVHGLGIQVRDYDEEKRVVTEVHRSDGAIVTVLLGDLFTTDRQVQGDILTINRAKDLAESQGKADRLLLIEAKERAQLTQLMEKI